MANNINDSEINKPFGDEEILNRRVELSSQLTDIQFVKKAEPIPAEDFKKKYECKSCGTMSWISSEAERVNVRCCKNPKLSLILVEHPLDKEKQPREIVEREQDIILLMSKFSPVPYAEKLMKNHDFLFDVYKRFWRYDGQEGIWKEDADTFIKNRLRTRLVGAEQQKKSYIDEIVSYIKDISWDPKKDLEPPINIIAFNNCLYNLNNNNTLDFSSEYFICNKIPVDLNPEFMHCPEINDFLIDCVGEDKTSSLYELMAYCMLRAYPYQKFFILYGKGSNGKSVFLNLLIKFLGKDNVCGESPQSLVTNIFARGNLWGKLANIGSDIPYVSLNNTNIIKELTGEDHINCERKYQNPFPFKNFAKLIWSANELPQVNDKTYAFYRRVYIVGFPNIFEGKAQDKNLLNKLTTPENLSGLAWTLIKVLRDVREREWVFSLDPSVDEMELLYEDLSDPLNKFLRETTEKDIGSKIEQWELKDKFMKWLQDNGFRIWGAREINVGLRERYNEGKVMITKEDYNQETGKFEPVQKWYRCWEGIKWK